MGIHSETSCRTLTTKPGMREGLPQRVRCPMWYSGCDAAFSDAASTICKAVFDFPLLLRSFSVQKFTSIETTSLNIYECAMATCLRAGGCFNQLHASHETCWAFGRHSPSLLERVAPLCCTDGCHRFRWLSLDVLPHLQNDIAPVVPLFSGQIRGEPQLGPISFHFSTLTMTLGDCLFSQAVHVTTRIQADTLLTSSSDGHLQSATARLSVSSRHVAVST